jgi:hypothetical protein
MRTESASYQCKGHLYTSMRRCSRELPGCQTNWCCNTAIQTHLGASGGAVVPAHAVYQLCLQCCCRELS